MIWSINPVHPWSGRWMIHRPDHAALPLRWIRTSSEKLFLPFSSSFFLSPSFCSPSSPFSPSTFSFHHFTPLYRRCTSSSSTFQVSPSSSLLSYSGKCSSSSFLACIPVLIASPTRHLLLFLTSLLSVCIPTTFRCCDPLAKRSLVPTITSSSLLSSYSRCSWSSFLACLGLQPPSDPHLHQC